MTKIHTVAPSIKSTTEAHSAKTAQAGRVAREHTLEAAKIAAAGTKYVASCGWSFVRSFVTGK